MTSPLADRDTINGVPVRPFEACESTPGSLFHTTGQDKVIAICEEGIHGEYEKSYRDATEQFVKTTLAEADRQLPLDRQNVVYCWPLIHTLAKPSTREATLEIEFDALETAVYAADFSLATEIVTGYEESPIRHGIPPEENDELKETVHAYADSLTQVKTWDDILEATTTCDRVELLIETRVPSTALTAVWVPESES